MEEALVQMAQPSNRQEAEQFLVDYLNSEQMEAFQPARAEAYAAAQR
jgi:hypothetical protein